MTEQYLKRSDVFYIGLLLIGVMMLVSPRFGWDTFPDSVKYGKMVLGNFDVAVPFVYRILVPVLAMPLAMFMSAYTVLSLISVFACVGLTTMMYLICREYTDYGIVAFVVTCAAALTRCLVNYGGVPLVDATAMFFCSVIVYMAIRGTSSKYIVATVVLGVFAKELVLFAALFVLLYNRDWRPLVVGGIVTVMLRYVISGIITQPLRWHEASPFVMVWTEYVLIGLVILTVFCIPTFMVQDDWMLTDSAMRLAFAGLLAFYPYFHLGVYYVAFGVRFVWPLQFAFLGVCSIGLDWYVKVVVRKWR